MKKILFAAMLFAALIPMAVAQSISTASSSAVRGNGHGASLSHLPPKAPSWCKPCLYYSGDIDTTNPNADGIWDNNYSGGEVDGQIFGAFKNTTKTVKATGGAINAFGGPTTTDPTPWQINTKMSAGNGGKVVCSGSGTTTIKATGRTDSNWGVPDEYSVIEKKFKKACSLKKGSYWLLIYPQSTNLWYESDEESDPKPINHVGWKNVIDKSIFNSTYFGFNYAYANTIGDAGGDDFSFGLIGK